jgi:hypothetical protein
MTVISGSWLPLNTDIETHMGLQFGVNVTEVLDLDDVNTTWKSIALHDIARGDNVDTRKSFDSFYAVDDERLVQIGKYSKDKEVLQCYNGKNGLLDGATVYYNGRGNLFVKDSQRTIRQIPAKGGYVKTDLFAGKKR